jgi:glycine cleavage system H protein
MFTLKPANAADLGALMDAAAYAAHVESEAH